MATTTLRGLAMLAVVGVMGGVIAQGLYPGSCQVDVKGMLQQDGLCANSFGGFHVLCNQTNYWLAEEACAAQGWRLAAVTDLNTLFALQTAEMCLNGRLSAWVAAYNGLNQDPCMEMTYNGIISAGLHAEVCQGQTIAVMCQEVPVLSRTTTTSTTLTTSVGTLTRHTTVTHHPYHGCRGAKCDAPPQLKNAEVKRVDDEEGEKRAFPPNREDGEDDEEEDEDRSGDLKERGHHRRHRHRQHRSTPSRQHSTTAPPPLTSSVSHHIRPTHHRQHDEESHRDDSDDSDDSESSEGSHDDHEGRRHHRNEHRECFNCSKEFAVSEKVPACDAAEACHQLGMKLADVTIGNWERATKALFDGIGPHEHGWVASWNGDHYRQAECIAMFTGSRAPGGSINIPPFCREPKRALCQRAPHFQMLMQDEQQQGGRRPQFECNTCLGYCAVPETGLRILRRPTTYEKAAAACARYGWKLADVTAGTHSFLTNSVRTCFNNDGFAALWVRSYEGVTSSRCLSVWTQADILNARFGLSPPGCVDNLTYPLCQCDDSVFTGYGPFEGTSTTTTVQQTTTILTVVPQTTVTVTSTVCGRCRADPSSCGCSSSSDSSSWSYHSDSSSSSSSSDSSSSSSDSSTSDHRYRHRQGHNRGRHGRHPKVDF